MASRVNTRFVAFLAIGLMLLGGGGLVAAYFALAKSGEEYAAIGDEHMAKGEYEKAYEYYGKAVYKKRTNPEWIDKWLGAMRKTTPTPRQAYMERYGGEYRLGLKAYAESLPEDVKAQRRYLDELYNLERASGKQGVDGWDDLIVEVETSIKRFTDPEGPARELRRYRAFANIAKSSILTGEQGKALFDAIRSDLEAARAANPADAEVTVEYASVLMRLAEMKRAEGGPAAPEAAALEKQAHTMLGEHLAAHGPDSRVLWRQILIEFIEGARASTRPTRATLYEDKHDRLVELMETLKTEPAEHFDVFVLSHICEELRRSPLIGNAGVLDLLYEMEKKHPDRLALQIMIGGFESASQHHEKAVAAYQKVIDAPDQALSLEGWMQFQQRASAYRSQILAKLDYRDQALSMLSKGAQNPGGAVGIDEKDARAALDEADAIRAKLAEYVGEAEPVLLYVDARLEYAKGNLERARTKLDDYNERTFNRDVSALVLQGNIMERLSNTGAARTAYQMAIGRDPSQFDAMFRLADLEEREQNFAEAVRILEGAQRQLPSLDVLNERLSRARQLRDGMAQGSAVVTDTVVKAVMDAQELVQGLNPDFAGAAAILRAELARQQNIPVGMPKGTSQDVIVLYPMLAQVLARAGSTDEALEVVKRGLAISPGHPRLTALKNAMEIKDPLQSSLAAIEDDEKATPFQKHVWRYLLYGQFGKAEEATAELASAQKLEPDHPVVYEISFRRALSEKNMEEAKRLAAKAAEKNIDNANGLTYKAQLEVAENRLDDAATTLEAALEQDRHSVPVWRQLGKVRLATGKFDLAAKAFTSALAIRPQDLDCIKGFIQAKTAAGQAEDALRFAHLNEKYGIHDLEFVDLWLSLESQARGGDPTAAIERRQQLAKRFAEAPPGNAQLVERNNVALVQLLIGAGRLEEARVAIDRMRSGGSSASAIELDVRWHMAQNNIGRAIEIFNGWVTSLPPEQHTEQPYIALANVFAQYGRSDAALQALRDGRAHQAPGSVEADRALGELLFQMGRYDQAVEAFNAILAKNPADPDQRINLYVVEAYVLQKRFDEALQRIASLGSAASGNSRMLLLKADAQAGKGEILEAERTYDAAIALDKGAAIGYIKRAQFLARDEKYFRDAQEDLEQAIKLEPRHLGARRLLVSIYVRKNEPDAAVAVFRDGLVLDPDNDTMRLDLVGLHLRLKQEREAVGVVDEVLRRRAEDPYWLLQGREVMYVLKRWNDAAAYALRLWEKKKDTEAALAYVDAALKMETPDYVKVMQVLATPSLKTDTDLRLLMARARVQLKRQRVAEVMTDVGRALGMIDPNQASHAQMFMAGMSVLYPDPKERLTALTAVRPREGFRTWLAFFYANLKTSLPETAAEGLAELKAIGESNATVGLRKQCYALIGARVRAEKKSEEAINWWKEGLKLDAADPELNNNVAYALAEDLNKPQEGLAFAEKSARVRPENASIQDTLGWIYFKLGQMDKAEGALVQAMSYATQPEEQVPVLIHMARLKLTQGKKEEAGAFVRRAQEMIRNNDQLKAAYEGLLQELQTEIGAP